MKLKRFVAAFSSGILAFSSLLTLAVPSVVHAAAQTCTWTGATDNKFSTATNWSGCGSAAPTNGDNLVFNNTSLSAEADLNNDITNLSTGTVTFSGTQSFGFKISGNAFTLAGNITNSSAGQAMLDADVSLGADVAVSLTSTYAEVIFGDYNGTTAHTLNTQGHNLSYSGTGAGCGLYNVSKLTGTGNVVVNLSSKKAVMFVNDSSTFTGGVTVDSGIFATGGLGSSTGITVNDGGSLGFMPAQDATFNFPITLNGNGASANYATLMAAGDFSGCGGGSNSGNVTLAGPVTLNSDVTYGGSENTVVTGTFNANGHKVTNLAGATGTFSAGGATTQVSLTKRSIDASDNQPTVQEYVSQGEEVTLDGARGDTDVDGVLKGSGTIGKLTVNNDGTVAPGHSPGCLAVTGGLQEYGIYQAEIGGTDPCTGYDQLKVTGTVDLGGTNGNTQGILKVSRYNDFKPAAGQSYTIIDNDGSDAVQGTFKDLAEGATFEVDGYVLQISYTGGDGNDVVLTVKNVPAIPDTGFALIAANPLLSLAISSVAAGAILVVAQKTRTAKAVVRRKR
jgi:hypothetical protein